MSINMFLGLTLISTLYRLFEEFIGTLILFDVTPLKVRNLVQKPISITLYHSLSDNFVSSQ